MPAYLQQSSALLALIAILPGLTSWWFGRRLRTLADDPILPERLTSYQRRNGFVLVLAAGTITVLSSASLVWTLPLVFVATYAGAFPLRQVLFAETWSLAAYLWFFTRLYAGLFGFWFVLAAVPALASAAGGAGWLAAVLLACALLVWNDRYAAFVRICLRTRPLDEGPFLDRCRQLAAACSLPATRFERIDLHGGVIANALALPSRRGSSVLYTDTLLARLDSDEAAAICAHELGHLEHYHPQRLRRLHLISMALTVLAAAWTPAFRLMGMTSGWTTAAWLGVLTAALVVRARDKQRQETACDAKAVALVGAEPTISALTRLYTIARIPRRVDVQQDRSGTHPSLARRIRDIRKAAGSSPTPLETDASFTSPDGHTIATFERAALRWVGSDSVTQTVEYRHLSEIRIDARRGRTPRLMARGPEGRHWEMPLAASDLGRAQSVLDVVDSRLGDVPAAPPIPFKFTRLFTGVVTLIALMFGQFAVAVVALLASIRLATPLLAAAGLAAVTGGATTLRGGSSSFDLVVSLVFMLLGSGLLALAWWQRNDPHANVGPILAVLAVCGFVAAASIALNGIDAVRIYQAALATPAALVWPVALAGALACSPARRARIGAAAVVSVAAVTSAVGSPLFLELAADDPFLVDAPAVRLVAVDTRVLKEFAVPASTSRLRLSPDGRTVAAFGQVPGAGDVSSTLHVGRIGDALTPVAADAVLFLDDAHVLTASSDRRGTTVRKVSVDAAGQVLWEQRVEDLLAPRLSFDQSGHRWRLTGWTADETMVRAEGAIDSAEIERMRWPAAATGEAAVNAFTTSGTDALVVETRFDAGPFERLPPRWYVMLLMLQRYNQESRYWRIGPASRVELGMSRLGADCHAGLLAEDALVCSSFDGTRTRLFTLRADGRIHGLATIDGRFTSDRNIVPGWLSGWAESTPVAIRLATRDAFRLPEDHGPVGHLSASADRLAAVTFAASGPTVRIYALDRAEARDAARR
jgi:Zn-dependent protease with chaperone function